MPESKTPQDQAGSRACSGVADKPTAEQLMKDCAEMSLEDRRITRAHTVQLMIKHGLNGFAAELLTESLLRANEPIPIDIIFPMAREDCEGWAGVRIQLTPIRVASER